MGDHLSTVPSFSPIIPVTLGDLDVPYNEPFSGFLVGIILRKCDMVSEG